MSQFICIDGPGSLTQAKLLSKHLQAKRQPNVVVSGQQLGGPAGYFINRYREGNYGEHNELNAYHVARIFGLTFLDINTSLSRLLSSGTTIICYDFVGSAILNACKSISELPNRNGFFLWCDQYYYDSLGLLRPHINIILDNNPDSLAEELCLLQPNDYTLIKTTDNFGVAQTYSKLLSFIFTSNLEVKNQVRSIKHPKSSRKRKKHNFVVNKATPPTKTIYLQKIAENLNYKKSLGTIKYGEAPPSMIQAQAVKLIRHSPFNELDIGLSRNDYLNANYKTKQKSTIAQYKKLIKKSSSAVQVKYQWHCNISSLVLVNFIRMGYKKSLANIKLAPKLNNYAKSQIDDEDFDIELNKIESLLQKDYKTRIKFPTILGQAIDCDLNLNYTETIKFFERANLLNLPELNDIVGSMLTQISEVHPLGYECFMNMSASA